MSINNFKLFSKLALLFKIPQRILIPPYLPIPLKLFSLFAYMIDKNLELFKMSCPLILKEYHYLIINYLYFPRNWGYRIDQHRKFQQGLILENHSFWLDFQMHWQNVIQNFSHILIILNIYILFFMFNIFPYSLFFLINYSWDLSTLFFKKKKP